MHQIRKGLLLALVFILTWMISVPGNAQTNNLTISINQIPVGDDYAYSQRGFFWDFSDVSHYASELTANDFNHSDSLVDGMFTGSLNRGDERVTLLTPPIIETNLTQYEGAYHPIDSTNYRYVTVRLCVDQGVNHSYMYYFTEQPYQPSNFGAIGPKYLNVGCSLVIYDMFGTQSGSSPLWNTQKIMGLGLRTGHLAGTQIKVDFVRLSKTADSGKTMRITWPSGSSPVDLFFDTNYNGQYITPISNILSGSSYDWVVPNLVPGIYYIFSRTNGGALTRGPLFTVNTPPAISIQSPGYTSGNDFATIELNDPWDMSNPQDIAQYGNIANASIDNGIFVGTNTNSDPWINFNLKTSLINPSKYYYLTYRMRVSGEQDIGLGSVTRLFWTTSPNQVLITTTKDIVIYENWQTVTVDLRTASLVDPSLGTWQNGLQKYSLRLDPFEFPATSPRAFYLDDIKLTGNSSSNSTFNIAYNAKDPDGTEPRVRFFYSSSPDGTNAIPLTCTIVTTQPPTLGPHTIYLPLVLKGSNLGDSFTIGSSQLCNWNVSQVPAGTYYIIIEGFDGIDTVTRVSAAPVEIFH